MTPAERKRIKSIASQCFDVPLSQISVRQGRGTARSWKDVTVKGSRPTPETQFRMRGEFEKRIRAERLASTYWPDDGFSEPGDGLCIYVTWEGQ